MSSFIRLHIILLMVTYGCQLMAQNTKGVRVIGDSDDSFDGETYALVIGISKYQNIQSLDYADKDAIAFYNYLLSRAGGEVDSSHIQLLTNENANVGNVSMGLQWLKDVVKPKDNVIIYFSGHGDVENLTNAQNGFLLTYNSPKTSYWAGGTIPIYILKDYISTLSAQNSRVIFIADACRSGKLAGGEAGTAQSGAALQQQWGNEIKILSCQPGELSLESRNIGGGRGLFSYHLIRGLQGLADGNQDNNISLSELMIYLAQKVPSEADPLPQNPILTGKMQSKMAFVDKQTLAEIMDENKNSEELLASVNGKGLLGNLDELNYNWKEKYAKFETYINEGKSYLPGDESAWSIYLEFKDSLDDHLLINLMERNLLSGLQNEAQIVINDYIEGKYNTWSNKLLEQRDFQQAAKKLELCRGLVGSNNPFQKSFLARQFFLEAHTVIWSNDTLILRNALQKLDSSITLEPYAAYTYETQGLLLSKLKDYKGALKAYSKASELAPLWTFPINNSGVVYHNMKDYDKAKEYYQKAIDLDSTYTIAYNGVGVVYHNMKDYDKAKEYYQKAIYLDSTEAIAYYNLGIMYNELKNYDQAKAYYQKAIDLVPTFTNAYAGLGTVYHDMKEYDQAKVYYEIAIYLDSTYTDVYYNLGNVYYEMKDYDQAKAYYHKTINLDFTYTDAYYNLGNICYYMKDYDQAIPYYHKTIDLDSTYTDAYYNLGNVYYEMKDYDKAKAYYQKAIDLVPTFTNAYAGLGTVYYDMKEYDQAKAYYQIAIDLDSTYTDVYYNLGNVYCNIRDYDQAKAYYQIAIDLDSTYTNAYYYLGNIYYNMRDYDQAKAYYHKTINLDFTYTDTYYNLGNIYYNMMDYDQAISYYQTAIDLDSTYTNAYYYLGNIYYNMRDYDQAIPYYEKTIDLDSTYTNAYFNLGLIYEDLNNYDQAIACNLKAIGIDPNFTSALSNLAIEYQYQKSYVEAIKYHEEAIRSDSSLLTSYVYLVLLSAIHEDNEKVIWYSKKVLELDVNGEYHEQILSLLAYSYLSQDNFVESKKYFEQALELDNTNPDSYYNLSCYYSITKNQAEALEYLEQALIRGYDNYTHIQKDTDLENIRSLPEFIELLSKYLK